MSNTRIKQADFWRGNYNPLRGLNMARVVTYLDEAERGAYADIQWIYRQIEKRDATLRGVIRKLKASIKKLDWDIKIPDGLDEAETPLAEAQQVYLRKAYDKIQNIRAAIGNLVMSEFRGFAHLEKVYQGNDVVALELVPQWHWVRDGIYGEWQLNPEAKSGIVEGEEVTLDEFLIREVDDPANLIALIAFVRKSLSQKDWDAFIETYGLPAIFAILGDQVGDDERDATQLLVETIIGNARGVLPKGTDIKMPGDSVRGNHPFSAHIRYQDEQIVLAGTSGTLTMLTDSTGMNSGQADAQTQTFDALAVALAGDISEVFQEQFDQAMLEAAFPDQRHYAYFELAAKEEDDVDAEFDRALKASQAGYRIPADELAEKTGYKLESAPVPTQAQQTAIYNRENDKQPAPSFEDQAREQFAKALAKDLQPLRERLEELMDLGDDADLEEAVAELESEYESLFAQLRKSGASDEALYDILMSAAVGGVDEALSKLSKIGPKKAATGKKAS